MSKTSERASRAQRLRDDEAFKEFLEDTRQLQAAVFLDPNSQPEEREEAHAIVRALSKLDSTLEAAIADWTVEQKKGQHRGSD